jgi:hypothetical protein
MYTTNRDRLILCMRNTIADDAGGAPVGPGAPSGPVEAPSRRPPKRGGS